MAEDYYRDKKMREILETDFIASMGDSFITSNRLMKSKMKKN